MIVTFEKKLQGHKSAIYKLIDLPKDRKVLSAGGDGWIASWDKSFDQLNGVLVAEVGEQIFSMSYDEKSGFLAVGGMSGSLYWLDINHNRIVKNIKLHKRSIFSCFNFDDYLFTLGGDGSMIIWDNKKLEAEHIQVISAQGLRCMAFSPSGKLIAIGSSDNCIYILEADSYKLLHKLENAHNNSVFTLKFISDTLLLSGGRDAILRLWNMNELREVRAINAHWYTINDITFIADFDIVVTASRDKTVRFWNASDFSPITTIDLQRNGHFNSVNCLFWDNENHLLFTAGDDREIRVFSISTLSN